VSGAFLAPSNGSTNVSSPDIFLNLARARGDLYRILSRLYLHMPDKTIFDLNWQSVDLLLAFPMEGAEEALQRLGDGFKRIKACLSKRGPADETWLTDLSKDWTRLFRGVEKRGILPPYESLYRSGKLQEKPAQEIHRLFARMGIRVPDEWHQPPDYVGVELDFMRFLCEKEEHAREKNEKILALETVEVERSFIANHLGQWVSIFCARMFDEAREDFYRGVARLTVGLVQYDQAYLPRVKA